MLLDMEALLGHRYARLDDTSDTPDMLAWAQEQMENSVYWTELLPMQQVAGNGVIVNIGALGEALGEDASQSPESNLPQLNQKVVPPLEWIASLEEGFRHTYQLLLHHRESLLRPDSPLLRARAHTGRRDAFRERLAVVGRTTMRIHQGVEGVVEIALQLVQLLARVQAGHED